MVRETELNVPFNAKTDKFETLSKVLMHDSVRNRLILKDIKQELDAGRKAVVITERKEHIEALYQYLKQACAVVTLSGEDPESARAAKWKTLKEGHYQALLTTGQFFGEGTDLNNATCLAVLKNDQVKHYRQLRYLADRHERAILKLRFVLSPFSFVFLLAGEEQFHIILETLDTEEATYIWHIPKDKNALREALKRIDRDLGIIRQHGRQYFLDTQPANFSRVVHDYSEGRKGFVVWKDLVEERLG